MKKYQNAIFAFLFLFFLFFISLPKLLTLLGYESEKPIIDTIWHVKAAYPCEFVKNQWVSKEVFKSSEPIRICTSISTNKTLTEYDLSIRVYNEADFSRDRSIFPRNIKPIFEEYYQFSTKNKYIRINYDFQPGKYVVEAIYVRDTLFEIPIEITE